MITPVAVILSPAVIAGSSDDGISNLKSNFSRFSDIISAITGTRTILLLLPLANVAVNEVFSKSTPPVSQTFSQHMHGYTHYKLLPSAETHDFSDTITVTLNVSGNAPPTNSRFTCTNPAASDPVY